MQRPPSFALRALAGKAGKAHKKNGCLLGQTAVSFSYGFSGDGSQVGTFRMVFSGFMVLKRSPGWVYLNCFQFGFGGIWG